MTLAAIEVSITMMLELFYGWDAYHCGFCLTIMCPVGIVLAVAMKILINSGFLSESSVYFSAMLASVIGAAMLFDGGNAGAWTLIAGGTVIFSGALACATKVSYHLSTTPLQENPNPLISDFYWIVPQLFANCLKELGC